MLYKFQITTPEGTHQATSFKAAKAIAQAHPGAKIQRIHRQLIAYRSRINGVVKERGIEG